MHIKSETVSGMVHELQFDMDMGYELIPGVIWSPLDAVSSSPVLLIGHGGGQHKEVPGIVASARMYVDSFGFIVVAIDLPGHGDRPPSEKDAEFVEELTDRINRGQDLGGLVARQNERIAKIAVPEWQGTIDGLRSLVPLPSSFPVGYIGLSMSGDIGIHLAAVEPRIEACVIGLVGLGTNSLSLARAAGKVAIPVEFVVQWDDELVSRESSLALFDRLASGEKSLHANTGGHSEVPAYEREGWPHFFTRHLTSTGMDLTGD